MGSTPTGISGSLAATVLGLNPWSTPVQVWIKIMEDRQPGFCAAHGFVPPEKVDNAPIRWGLAFEDAVIDLCQDEQDEEIVDRELAVAHPDHEFITAHIDGRYSESGALHEGKTTSAIAFGQKWGEPGSDHIPREYQIQVQHQMIATPANEAIASVLVFPRRVDEFEAMGWETIGDGEIEHMPTKEAGGAWILGVGDWAAMLYAMGYFHQYHIEANPSLQSLMLEVYLQWWNDHVIKKTPPSVEGYDDIKRLCPEPKGTVVADERAMRLSAEYKQIGKEAAALKKRQNQIKGELLGTVIQGAEHPIDEDSVEAIVLRDPTGRKLHSYSKTKKGVQFR